jgi:hypothetical protein
MTDSFTSSIESVLSMNSQAVTFLCHQQPGATTTAEECAAITAAGSLLRLAFEKLVSSMMILDSDQDMKDSCGSSSSFDIETYPVTSCDVNGQQQLSTFAHSFSPSNAFEFYSKPFHVRFTSTPIRRRLGQGSSDNNNMNEQILVAATVMYNLGLTNQILAITTGKSAHLQKSVVHYHRALQLLDQVDGGIHDVLSTHVLLLAICNNCGYCRSHMLDSVSAQNFQQYIKFILDNLPRPSSSSSKNEHGDHDCFCFCFWETECDYFYSSACCFCGGGDTPVLNLAPAA